MATESESEIQSAELTRPAMACWRLSDDAMRERLCGWGDDTGGGDAGVGAGGLEWTIS